LDAQTAPALNSGTATRPRCRFARRAAPARALDQSRSEALTGIIGARRAWTISMISPLCGTPARELKGTEVVYTPQGPGDVTCLLCARSHP
jgi:hypothetical protein